MIERGRALLAASLASLDRSQAALARTDARANRHQAEIQRETAAAGRASVARSVPSASPRLEALRQRLVAHEIVRQFNE